MVTVAPNPPTPPGPKLGTKLESLTRIDVSKLTQSELHALSLCSDSAFDLRRSDDLVIPAVDRSVFNESAGTRRQTYSRPRPGRPRLSGLLPSHKPPPGADPHRAENKAIVRFLKQFLSEKQNSAQFNRQSELQLVVYDQADGAKNADRDNQERGIVVDSSERKRKRGRKPKAKVEEENEAAIELEIVNRNGVPVDLAELANADELYSGELRRRSGELGSEEEGLGFLGGLEGQWCSRRKKRRIVDASEFGDSLPVGWKLLLALKKREGRVWVYCRRYISPSGQHFVSCKEVASYLQSYFGYNDANQPMDQRIDSIQQTYSESRAGFADKADRIKHGIVSNSTISDRQEKAVSLMGIDNLAEVQVRDLFECYKCNMIFDEKDVYLQHLLTIHQRTTRRYRLGTSVGEGVIIKDGKYECQFCHKVFEERRSYNGHVGNHVKKFVRNSKELAGQLAVQKSLKSPPQDKVPSRISKMDALIEILETSRDGPNDKSNGGSSPNKQNVKEAAAADSGHGQSLGIHQSEIKECLPKRPLNQELNQHDSKYMTTGEKIVKSDGTSDVRNNINVVCTSTPENRKLYEVEKYGNSELEKVGLGNSHVKSNHDVAADTIKQTVKENMIRGGVTDLSMQSIRRSPAFTAIPNKKLENVTRFEELRLDKIEPLRYGFTNGQESPSLGNNNGTEEGSNSSDKFKSEAVTMNMGRHQLTTVCVWCRTEFKHEAIDLEAQSDSIGFMCPSCKAKISGHLDSGLSMSSHRC